MPRNHQIWPEFGISDHCWLIRCPVDGLAGGCGARSVSRKTPIYFIIDIINIIIFTLSPVSEQQGTTSSIVVLKLSISLSSLLLYYNYHYNHYNYLSIHNSIINNFEIITSLWAAGSLWAGLPSWQTHSLSSSRVLITPLVTIVIIIIIVIITIMVFIIIVIMIEIIIIIIITVYHHSLSSSRVLITPVVIIVITSTIII